MSDIKVTRTSDYKDLTKKVDEKSWKEFQKIMENYSRKKSWEEFQEQTKEKKK